ncbi:hypothetical protein [Flagellimonas abyssi]|uniref:Uncharacterized protein n=1 Tax=Flagellimonas abyssi TaxID=2864871 RepID=A0ABS7EVS7_9FLAO|nr:hypothetical protein [Allomuricauda abyssi]MBW8201733.1 hypothetical protein [Allomuricauda abyssi]
MKTNQNNSRREVPNLIHVNGLIYDNNALDTEDDFVVGGISWASSTITYGAPNISNHHWEKRN